MKIKRTPPNIIIIYPDSLTACALGCYGNPNPVSPNIDVLAETGVKFVNCISSNPLCLPSRASLHTGCYVNGHNVRSNSTEDLDAVYPSMAKNFRSNGYALAYFGKSHSVNQEEWDEVFDLYPDYNRYLKAHNYDVTYPEKPPVKDLCAGQSAVSNEDFSENVLGNIGAAYIREMAGKDQPFLLFMSHEAPHSPWTVPEEYYDFLSNTDIELPQVPESAWNCKHHELATYLKKRSEAAPDDETLKFAVRIYQTLIKIVDDNVGKLLEALDETGLRDNTIIVVTSDHGDLTGNFRAMGKCISPADNLLRVPLIFNAPERWQPQQNRSIVQNIDIFPTLAEIAGIRPPENIHGVSLVATLDNETPVRKYAFSEEHDDLFDSWMSVQDEEWKMVFYASGRKELYNVLEDPMEWNDLAATSEAQPKLALLQDELIKWRFRCIDRKHWTQ